MVTAITGAIFGAIRLVLVLVIAAVNLIIPSNVIFTINSIFAATSTVKINNELDA